MKYAGPAAHPSGSSGVSPPAWTDTVSLVRVPPPGGAPGKGAAPAAALAIAATKLTLHGPDSRPTVTLTPASDCPATPVLPNPTESTRIAQQRSSARFTSDQAYRRQPRTLTWEQRWGSRTTAGRRRYRWHASCMRLFSITAIVE